MKTCKNISKMHPVDEFICSECGVKIQDWVEICIDEDEDEICCECEFKFCPNCGRRVVE